MQDVKLKLAILDMYNGVPNQGMRCIQDILASFSEDIDYKVFDVRQKAEVPDLSFDLFISTGGPGDPREGDGVWDKKWFDTVQAIYRFNQNPANERKKHLFLICHSFQMACIHFDLGTISARQSMSFGTFPVYLTTEGCKENLFDALENPFYIADFRSFQVLQPNKARFKKMNAAILAKEKPRPHIPLERAIMAIRFSDEIIGTQFHPEADGDGMLDWFQQEEKKQQVILEHGENKYKQMMFDLSDPMRIEYTQNTILPTFLRTAIAALSEEGVFA